MKAFIDKLERQRTLSKEEFVSLIDGRTSKLSEYLFEVARRIRHENYGKNVYLRGLIEITNYCRNDCYYCGIRKSNKKVSRYRLCLEEILFCCKKGYDLGFRTFVLQGGEDGYYNDEVFLDIIREIKKCYPNCALTLSVGERSYESYKSFFDAGTDRFLLRHETANSLHYSRLHPAPLNLAKRKKCLTDLKAIGYQVGSGFMVGSPGQTSAELAEDLLYLNELQPQMVGVGPFISCQDTPFASQPSGTAELTLFIIGLIRLMLPAALIPATTALETIDPLGYEKGILAGANVIMQNLSPREVRKKYLLYDNKVCISDQESECWNAVQQRIRQVGYQGVVDRGDFKEINK